MSPRARILFVVLMFMVAAVCVRLGMWQRSRLLDRRAANAAATSARQMPPVDLAHATDAALADRRVTAQGTFDQSRDMLLRGQVLSGSPGVVVVTPLLGARGDSAILVVRGFIPSPDGISVPQLDSLGETGGQSVSGIARTIPDGSSRAQPLLHDGHMTWKELELGPLRQQLPYPLLGVVLFATPGADQPAWPRRLEPPPLDDGPHKSYMLQWFGFATIAVVTALLVTMRRQAAEWSEPTAGSSSAGAPPPPRSP